MGVRGRAISAVVLGGAALMLAGCGGGKPEAPAPAPRYAGESWSAASANAQTPGPSYAGEIWSAGSTQAP